MSKLPTKDEALILLKKYVEDDYQILHAKMVATALEAYAQKYGEDRNLWYITGLLHDIDYYKYPSEHPLESLKWFKEWQYPEELIEAVAAHYWKKTNQMPTNKLSAALISIDELAGFLYAYSLMRPGRFTDMEASSVKKKFKDKTFAAKIDREEILFGVEKLGVDFSDHVNFLINIYKDFDFETKN